MYKPFGVSEYSTVQPVIGIPPVCSGAVTTSTAASAYTAVAFTELGFSGLANEEKNKIQVSVEYRLSNDFHIILRKNGQFINGQFISNQIVFCSKIILDNMFCIDSAMTNNVNSLNRLMLQLFQHLAFILSRIVCIKINLFYTSLTKKLEFTCCALI